MIPFFTSDNSIGRSILKLKPTKQDGGPSDILTMVKEAALSEVFLVEDTMIGFLDAHKLFSGENISLRFGVRFKMCNDVTDEDHSKDEYKLIVFATSDDGCKELYRLFSKAHTEHNGYLDCGVIKEFNLDNFLFVHPFYDSYLYQNTFYFKNCIFDSLIEGRELWAWEENGLPMDTIMHKKLAFKVASCVKVKTVLYRARSDVEAYQVYRMACSRSFSKKSRGLSSPDLEHFGSAEFCFQSYMEYHGKPFKI